MLDLPEGKFLLFFSIINKLLMKRIDLSAQSTAISSCTEEQLKIQLNMRPSKRADIAAAAFKSPPACEVVKRPSMVLFEATC